MMSGAANAGSSECRATDKQRWEKSQQKNVKTMIGIWLNNESDTQYSNPIGNIARLESLLFTNNCYSINKTNTISDIAENMNDIDTGDKLSFAIFIAALSSKGIDMSLNNLMQHKGMKLRSHK